ncbi:MAG TPA: c-type cytochrome [Xanthobacteraceae bacterium]|nr:c-type cytochrome [Xanthobacteraceae bacterium]
MIRLAMGIAAVVAMTGAAAAQSDLVKRGSYLVNTILTCGNCHTPKGPDGRDIKERAFSGFLEFDEPPWKVTASNITPDKETGIGKWTRAQIRTALTEGKRPNGVPLAAIMPSAFYKIFTRRDLDAVVAYVRSVKPIKNKVPDPVYRINVPHQTPPGAEKPFREADLRNPVKRGFYLVTIGHCMECHTPLTPKGRDYVNGLGKGGFELKGPWGVSVSRNITSHKEKGIGAWTDEEIIRAITQGVRKDGTKLKPPMGYSYYAGMTNADLRAIVAYLRTVPPKE